MNSPLSFNQTHANHMILNGCLFITEFTHHCLSFTIFNLNKQMNLYKTQFLETQLYNLLKQRQQEISLPEIYSQIASQQYDTITFTQNNLQIKVKLKNEKHQYITLLIQLTLNSNEITEKVQISYIKQFYIAKQENHKNQTLRLKSQIYCLMTQLQDVTCLVQYQSIQAKNARNEIKELKRQLQLLKKQKQDKLDMALDFGVQCNISQGEQKINFDQLINNGFKQHFNQFQLDDDNEKGVQITQKNKLKQISKLQLLPVNNMIKKQNRIVSKTCSQDFINISYPTRGLLRKNDQIIRIDNNRQLEGLKIS